MNLKDIPWYDRPGFRLTREGAEKLSNAELYLLFTEKIIINFTN